ncbi:hypothetical protein V3391_06710 [Luteimonas sp. SMYT11W]|uniref:Uncharacterized protein n=1 Tax=Luteimonas flava TaxID=3115822 RepID=A0ABU7WDE7_9GAMM
MADQHAPAATGHGVLLLGNADLVSDADTGYGRPAPLSPPEDDPGLALDHAAALRAIAPPVAPEPLA